MQNYPMTTKSDSRMDAPSTWTSVLDENGKFEFLRNYFDPAPSSLAIDIDRDEVSSEESYDIFEENIMPNLTTPKLQPELHLSWNTAEDSPPTSRPSSPRPSLPSSATSLSIYTLDEFAEVSKEHTRDRPSVLRRLKSTISASSLTAKVTQRPAVQLDDFRQSPEHPEKRYIDGSGIVIPGVCDRPRCTHRLAHHVSTFRLSEAIEYTTGLADHGITYTDYCRLVNILLNFMDVVVSETKRYTRGMAATWGSRGPSRKSRAHGMKSPFRNMHPIESAEMHQKTEDQATALNQLLAEITLAWQSRGLPVMVCVSSFSLFAPHRISEAHIQILHVPFTPRTPSEQPRSDSRTGDRLSFIDPLSFMPEDTNIPVPWRKHETSTEQTPSMKPASLEGHAHYQQPKLRDRSKPWPLWPNAIPSGKRQAMHENADRYGADPYFRAWIRANINSRTTSNTYVKFMIERENDPFVNKRLPYHDDSSRTALAWDTLTSPHLTLMPSSPVALNRNNYEHNRRLEARRTIENGTRLRILRFGLRHPIFPPHNAEMDELSLSKSTYDDITAHFNEFCGLSHNAACPVSYLKVSWHRFRRGSIEDVMARVGAYIRELNAAQRRIVWTLEQIPGVYDRGTKRERTEWEVSAWNGTCPLELLMDLERWGIVKQRIMGEGDGEGEE